MKPDFQDIKISDKELIAKLLGQNGNGSDGDISCEKQFATIFSWRLAHPVKFMQCGEGVIFKYTWKDECLFMIKQPSLTEFDRCVRLLCEFCQNEKIKLINMTEKDAMFLFEKYSADYSYDENYSDYIYEAENFRTYSGKKLHGKKNKLNKFITEFGDVYQCKKITPSVINDCLMLLDEWKADNGDITGYKRHEIVAVEQLIVHYSELDLLGCCLYIDEKPIGFTIGEALYRGCENSTLVVHSEKASYDYDGAYPALAHFFAVQESDFKYINREDDGGDPGLRKSKQSFSPLYQFHKYSTELDKKKVLSI